MYLVYMYKCNANAWIGVVSIFRAQRHTVSSIQRKMGMLKSAPHQTWKLVFENHLHLDPHHNENYECCLPGPHRYDSCCYAMYFFGMAAEASVAFHCVVDSRDGSSSSRMPQQSQQQQQQ